MDPGEHVSQYYIEPESGRRAKQKFLKIRVFNKKKKKKEKEVTPSLQQYTFTSK
jgi:hypothetical protein